VSVTAGASARGAAVTLTKTEAGLGEPGNQEVAIDGQGDAIAIWARMHGPAAETVETSEDHSLSAAWSAPVAVSGPGKMEEAPQIAVNEAGQAMIVWERQEPGAEIVEGSSGSATGVAWQPARAVSATTPGSEAVEPDVAMDAQGNAAAVWGALHSAVHIAEAAGFDAAGPVIEGLSIPTTGVVGEPLSFSVTAVDVWSPVEFIGWQLGSGPTYPGPNVTHEYEKPGTYSVWVRTGDILGNMTMSPVATLTIGPAATSLPTRPQLTGARLTHTRFRASKSATALSAAAKGKAPLGTSFRFMLSEAAGVQIVFTRSAQGLRSAGRCVAATPKLRRRHARRCTRTVTVGKLTRAHEAKGADTIAFSGRLGTRPLPPNVYTATLTAVASGQTSSASKLGLTIVR
jgi:hypothetical protein